MGLPGRGRGSDPRRPAAPLHVVRPQRGAAGRQFLPEPAGLLPALLGPAQQDGDLSGGVRPASPRLAGGGRVVAGRPARAAPAPGPRGRSTTAAPSPAGALPPPGPPFAGRPEPRL